MADRGTRLRLWDIQGRSVCSHCMGQVYYSATHGLQHVDNQEPVHQPNTDGERWHRND